VEARAGDRCYLQWPAELLGVVGDHRIEAFSLGSRVQLDVLGAGPALKFVHVNYLVCLQQDAHDLGHGSWHVLVE
jgi:hypothetical protein